MKNIHWKWLLIPAIPIYWGLLHWDLLVGKKAYDAILFITSILGLNAVADRTWPIVLVLSLAVILFAVRKKLSWGKSIFSKNSVSEPLPKRSWALIGLVIIGALFNLYAVDVYPPGFPQHTVFNFDVYYRDFFLPIENFFTWHSPLTALVNIGHAILDKQLGLVWLIESLFYHFVRPNFINSHFLPSLLGTLNILLLTRALDLGIGRWTALITATTFVVSPWHLSFSRYSDLSLINSVAHFSLVLICFVIFLREKSPKWAAYFGISLALGMYLYAPNQVICLLALPFVLFILRGTLSLRLRGISIGSFLLFSAPSVLWYWSIGRWIPIRTPYTDNSSMYKLVLAGNMDRAKEVWQILTANSSDPWFISDYGTFTPLDKILLLPGLAYGAYLCIHVLRKSIRREALSMPEAILSFVAANLFFGLLPSFLAPDAWARRMIIVMASSMILNSSLLVLGIRRLKSHWATGAIVLIIAYQFAAGITLYFTRTHSWESEVNQLYKNVAIEILDRSSPDEKTVLCFPNNTDSNTSNLDAKNTLLYLNFMKYLDSKHWLAVQQPEQFRTPHVQFLVLPEPACINTLGKISADRTFLIDFWGVTNSPLLKKMIERFGSPAGTLINPRPKIARLIWWNKSE